MPAESTGCQEFRVSDDLSTTKSYKRDVDNVHVVKEIGAVVMMDVFVAPEAGVDPLSMAHNFPLRNLKKHVPG